MPNVTGQLVLTDYARTNIITPYFKGYPQSTGNFKMALFTSAATLNPQVNAYSSLTGEVANGNGYTIGGVTVNVTLSGTNPVSVAVSAAQWTAISGVITARHAVLYEVGGNVVAYGQIDGTGQDIQGDNITINAGTAVTVA